MRSAVLIVSCDYNYNYHNSYCAFIACFQIQVLIVFSMVAFVTCQWEYNDYYDDYYDDCIAKGGKPKRGQPNKKSKTVIPKALINNPSASDSVSADDNKSLP